MLSAHGQQGAVAVNGRFGIVCWPATVSSGGRGSAAIHGSLLEKPLLVLLSQGMGVRHPSRPLVAPSFRTDTGSWKSRSTPSVRASSSPWKRNGVPRVP